MAPVRPKKTSKQADSPTRTPPKGISKRITQGQKQALIDNLQLEVTERARKLRAQYALQAHTLRSRVELRVNRIPLSLRKANIGDLLEKHLKLSAPESKNVIEGASKALPKHAIMEDTKSKATSSPVLKRGVKRTSTSMTDDKENTPDPSQNISQDSKRTKVENSTVRPVRNASTVLSPKSSNSRAILHSPARPPMLTQKSSNASRATSPLKPAPTAKAATAAATSMLASVVNEKAQNIKKASTTAPRKAGRPAAGSKGAPVRTKRGIDQPAGRVASSASNTSGSSAVSTGTTIVKRVGKALNVSTTTKKKVAVTKKPAPAKEKSEAASATGRRVLRKRA